MKLKRYIAAALAAAMIIAATATLSVSAAEFTDISGHWAEATIIDLADRGIVNGVSATEFNPDGTVTRAEFLKMAMEVMGIGTVPFRKGECLETQSTDWYAPYLQSALDKGLIPDNMIAGFNLDVHRQEDGTIKAIYSGAFNGYIPITREEMAVIAQYVYQYTRNANTMRHMVEGAKLRFSDSDSISGWAHEAVKLAYAQGFIDGMDDGTFSPNLTATRAQAATIISRMIM